MLKQRPKLEFGMLGRRSIGGLRAKMIIVCLAVLCGAGAVFFWWQRQAHPDWESKTTRVARGSIDSKITASGVIRPFNQVKISPKVSGLLRRLLVQQGDYVKKGQIIAVMDQSNLEGQVQAARGAYLAAKANYAKELNGNRPEEIAASLAQLEKTEGMVRSAEQAMARSETMIQAANASLLRDETNARRLSDLAAAGAVSDQDRLNAVTAAKVSRAQLEQYQKELKQAESLLAQSKSDHEAARQQYRMMKRGFRSEDVEAAHEAFIQAQGNLGYLQSQLADTTIRAPFDGVITQKYTDEGAIVTPTTSAATTSATSSSIVSLAGRLELVAEVAETDMDHIGLGQPVEIVANAYPDKVFHCQVSLIAPEAIVTQNVTTFEVHATINDDPRHRLMSGMNVNAQFLAGRKDNALLISTACIMSRQGKTGVLVPDRAGEPVFRPVKIGASSGTNTEVVSGLREGQRVYLGLTRQQLEEQGYADFNKPGQGEGGKPQIPRGFGHHR